MTLEHATAVELVMAAEENPVAVLDEIHRRQTREPLEPPLLAHLEVTVRLRSRIGLECAEQLARALVLHRKHAGTVRMLADVCVALGHHQEASQLREEAQHLPDRDLTDEVLIALKSVGLLDDDKK